ncbi:two component regulator with propeller domain [Breznakibacter xylanolyticus]|uniref:histidine kinase n=1 Tax=Breznakibacter xylanolyticus TaxID=990 RepID=A0A2W7NJH9_9BACT|nr:hybrid sensor histidine kinase/response regulator transcription factor [Breznakibacter xylanolyticus]PZX20418.1 two component regulator with propeller domain [Breznakibacter xylanolyticus]
MVMFVMGTPWLWSHGLRSHEFTSVDRRQGLNASVVHSMVQDYWGMMWLGTNNGLYGYDGYMARRYGQADTMGTGAVDGVINTMFMPDSIHLWLGAETGLLVYNIQDDRIETMPAGLPDNIRAIEHLDGSHYWLGSMNGLFRYDALTGKALRVAESLLPHQAIYTIMRYSANSYYMGTYNGLCRYQKDEDRFEMIPLGSDNDTSNRLILSLLVDDARSCIWVGVEGGLWAYYPATGQSHEVALLRGNSVKSLFLDNQGCLWTGTDNGLFVYDPVSGEHRLIRHNALNNRSLINNIVWSVYADRDANIWLGTDGGVSLYVHHDHIVRQSVNELTGSTEGNQIISLLTDTKGRLWLGGTNGLIMTDRKIGRSVWFQQNSKEHPLPHNKVRHIYEDRDGEIWIATDGSICRYDETSSEFERYRIEDTSGMRNANWAYAITQDDTGALWIATCLGGVFVVDKQQLKQSRGRPVTALRNYHSHGGASALSGTMPQSVAADVYGHMWVAVYRGGVNKIDHFTGRVIQFTTQSSTNALPSDDVTAMLVDKDVYVWVALGNQVVRMRVDDYTQEQITDARLSQASINGLADDDNQVWVSSTAGLFVIDKHTLAVRQISAGINYFSSVSYHAASRAVVAGGINELVTLTTEGALGYLKYRPVYLTGLWVNDELVDGIGAQNLGVLGSLRFARDLELRAHENNVSFAFSGFQYGESAAIQYAYRLQGVDAQWRFLEPGACRISYTDLRPGKYLLEVSYVGSDGQPVGDAYLMNVTVRHPWYLTWWSKLFYSVIFVLLVFALVNYWLVLNRLRYERLEKIKTMELTAHKIDFLTNISHELKTPLSLIIGPLGKLMEQVKSPELKEALADVRQNARKMGDLIRQLVDAGRQEGGSAGLMVSSIDVVALLRGLIAVFDKSLSMRQVTIAVQSVCDVLPIEGDVLKLEAVFNNILSNAAKFAPDGSKIQVVIEAMGDDVMVRIIDQGPGIHPDDLPHVFDRFFRSEHTLAQNREGSGVGMSIVREYVTQHRGRVTALSDGVRGTTIEVVLPLRQLVHDEEHETHPLLAVSIQDENRTDRPLLLIVEDNQEILSFLSTQLSREYRCLTAQNGLEGLDAAMSELPDIIVTDLMMPVMDGLTMCRKLKENITTSHIPVVMLTARDDRGTELTGYRTGADAFIAKPFEIGYLADRLHQVLRARRLMVQKVRQQAIIEPTTPEVVSGDEKFLQTITAIIEEELTNPELNVNRLSEKSGYSAKQVYRRIKALTGQTAVDYIRSVRLKKAATLLSKRTFTVAEVMYLVGFSNHSYFAKRFQEMYGKSPKQFMEGE